MRDEGKVGVQHDSEDFRGPVQRGHLVANSHLWVEQGVEGIRSERCHAGFQGSNVQLFPIYPPHQGRAELVRPRLCLHDAESRGQQREVVCVGRHVEQSELFDAKWLNRANIYSAAHREGE